MTGTLISVYCETSALESNIRHPDEKTRKELAAVQKLKEADAEGRIRLDGSLVNLREAANTKNADRRAALIVDHKGLSPVPKDERLLGIHRQSDPYGGFVNSPLISDTQDESMRDRLKAMGLSQKAFLRCPERSLHRFQLRSRRRSRRRTRRRLPRLGRHHPRPRPDHPSSRRPGQSRRPRVRLRHCRNHRRSRSRLRRVIFQRVLQYADPDRC
jgi:hypothetical protein